MRVIFMGTPALSVPFLEHLILNGYEVAAVYTQPDKPAGRGRPLASSPVKQVAVARGLPVFQPVSLRQPDAINELAGLKPDIIVLAAYGQILPQAVLDIPPLGCLNAHFSLLPRYRGAAPVAAAILAGDDFTGVSFMLVEKKLDTGPVLVRLAVPIMARDTTGSLTFRLSQVGARFMPEVVARWARKQIALQSQDESRASYAPPISREAGEINWHEPAASIWRRVRAYQPWPGCYTRWRGRQLKILEAVPLPRTGAFAVGQVISLDAGMGGAAFGVATGSEVLGIVRVQLEGRQAMAAADFLRGQRQFPGAILPS